MAYLTQLGAEETTGSLVGLEVLTRVDDRTADLVEGMKRAERRAKWQTIIGIGGAIFAAVRLGIIVIPGWRSRRRVGALADGPRENPARRRRRRRRRR